MLSILTRQAKLLEKELKDKQIECLTLRQESKDHINNLEARDCRIEVLEAEVVALRAAPLLHLAAVPVEEFPERPPAPEALLSDHELKDLKAAVATLIDKLGTCEGKLTFADLRASVLSLQKITLELTHMGVVQKLEASLKAAHAELSTSRARRCAVEDLELALAQATADVGRRDEQLAFLWQVHDASSSYDWVSHGHGGDATSSQGGSLVSGASPSSQGGSLVSGASLLHVMLTPRGGGLPVGSALSAVSLLSASGGPWGSSSRKGPGPVAALEELGVDAASATVALEAAGGDLDRAVLALFPAD
jgi:hypothetical protein